MSVMASERLLPPIQDCARLQFIFPRAFLATLFASLSVKAGINYIHLCEAGSRLVEGSAVWGAPLLVVALILFARRLWVGMLGAAFVTIVVYAVHKPYLDWVHSQ